MFCLRERTETRGALRGEQDCYIAFNTFADIERKVKKIREEDQKKTGGLGSRRGSIPAPIFGGGFPARMRFRFMLLLRRQRKRRCFCGRMLFRIISLRQDYGGGCCLSGG
jgi:hypothetical protein